MFEHLLSPVRIGSMALRNRVVMAPMGVEMVGDDGHANDAIIAYYEERARGGVGLIITEVCAIAYPHGANSVHQLGLSDDRYVADLRRLTDRIHEHGGKIAAQLVHHGKMSRVDARNGDDVLVPSLPDWHGSYDMASDLTAEELGKMMAAVGGELRPNLRPMTTDDIAMVTDQFADAARRARDAGFDGVEIHGAHGYLLSGFLSPQWNLRDDEYGGSVENRSRFLCEVLGAARESTGDEIPIWCRLDAREYRTPDGIRFADTTVTARLAQEAGAAAIHLSAYGDSTSASAFTEGTLPHVEAKHAAESAALKAVLDIPVIGVGRVRPETGDRMIAEGKADLIAMGRQMLADPETAAKLSDGRPRDIRPCINCYVCVASPFFDRRVHCAVNPALGNETELADATRTRAAEPKHVVIVGGGPAGMQAALSYASMGHDVTLYEQRDSLGGRWALVSCLNGRSDLGDSCRAFANRLSTAGVHVNTGVEITPQEIKELGADIIVLAVGARPHYPDIPGIDSHPHVMHADDVLENSAVVGEKVAIIGAGGAGVELAIHVASLFQPSLEALGFLARFGNEEWLAQALEHDRQVTLLKRRGYVGKGLGRSVRWTMMQDLVRLGVRVIDRTTFEKISRRGVHICAAAVAR